MKTIKLVLVVLFSIAIASCGGGGSSGGTTTPQTLSGTAATGLAIATATVTIKDVNGIIKTGTTGSDGSYTVDVTGMTLPFLMRAPSGTSYLYSVATATGTANIHPFTDLIIRNWYTVKGSNVDTVFAGPAPLLMPSIAEINTIEAVVRNILSTWLANVGLSASTFNLITSPFNANSSGFDKVLDNTAVVIDATGNVTVTTTNPTTGTVTTIVSAPITNLPTSATPDTTPPSNPTGLSALPASTTSIVLVWNASTDNVAVAGYNIYRDGTKIGSSPYPAYSDTGLLSGTLYSYTVKALDDALNESAASNTASATTQAGTSVSQFDGTYTGGAGTILLNLTVTNGGIIGTFSGQSTSGLVSGSVSASGSVTMSFSNSCGALVTLTGQITGVTMTGTASAPAAGTCASVVSAPWTTTRISTATGVSQFNGTYKGSYSGNVTIAGILNITVTNGVLTGTAAEVGSGNLTGTVSASGAVTMTTITISGCPGITATFPGQITGAVMTGTYSNGAGGSCVGETGTWTATRQ